MKHIKGDRRSSMGLPLLDAHCRIRTNGPHPSQFQPFYYVKKWLVDGHIRAEDPTRIHSKSVKSDEGFVTRMAILRSLSVILLAHLL